MAEMTITLRQDKNTGKQNILVKLDSEADATPIEHEQLHRKIVEKLMSKGFGADDLGELVIEREEEKASIPISPGERKAERRAISE